MLLGLDGEKNPVPEGVDYDAVKALFVSPEVADPESFDFKWNKPDEEGLRAYLVGEKGFAEERVLGGIAKLKKALGSGQQLRMDSFFTAKAATAGVHTPGAVAAAAAAAAAKAAKPGGKRKGDAAPAGGAGKKAKK